MPDMLADGDRSEGTEGKSGSDNSHLGGGEDFGGGESLKAEYGTNGRIVFDRLFDLLQRRGLNKQWLKNNGIHSNTVAKLTKNENVTCEVIANLCNILNCQPWELMEYKKNENT